MALGTQYHGYEIGLHERREAPEPPPQPVCTRTEICKGCPYPGHGFICWGRDERCMKTEVERMNPREENPWENM